MSNMYFMGCLLVRMVAHETNEPGGNRQSVGNTHGQTEEAADGPHPAATYGRRMDALPTPDQLGPDPEPLGLRSDALLERIAPDRHNRPRAERVTWLTASASSYATTSPCSASSSATSSRKTKKSLSSVRPRTASTASGSSRSSILTS